MVAANSANSKAEAALNAISSVVAYTPVANVAAIPATPADGDVVEVMDSTGIESFTPLTGVPAGFVGDSGLSAQITYSAAAGSWQWVRYTVVDPENRYGEAITSLVSDVIVLGDTKLDKTEAASTYLTQASATTLLADKADKATTYTKAELDTALAGKADQATTYTKAEVNTALVAKANLASPTFTGVPAVPTAAAGTSTTQIASTAFVASGFLAKNISSLPLLP